MRVCRHAIQRHRIVLSAVLLLLFAPAALWAHASLLRSVPASAGHVPSPPRELRLTFSEAPELAFTTVSLVDPAGAAVALAPATTAAESRRTLVAAIRGRMGAGTYTVRWQVAGTDGHPIRGQYVFTVSGTAPVDGAHHDPTVFPEGASGFGAESPLYVVVRWLQFMATVIVLGALCFTGVVVRAAATTGDVSPEYLSDVSRRAERLGAWAAAALAGTAVLRLSAQSYALHGAAGLRDASLLRGMVLHTRWGWGWGLQLLGVVLVLIGFRMHLQTSRGRLTWIVAGAGGVALAVALAMSGHAASVPVRPALAMFADTLHVGASGAWMGSLLMTLVVGVPAARRRAGAARATAVAALVRGLHPVALGAVGLLVLTGTYAAWLHVAGFDALWHSGYGRTLVIKLALVCVAVAIGGYNARRVRPHLVHAAGVQRFRRAARAELIAGLLVLLVTAVLVATPTALDIGTMQTP